MMSCSLLTSSKEPGTGAVRGRSHPLRAADHATPSLHAPQVGWGEHHPGGPTGPPGGAALHPEPKRHAAVAPRHRPRALQLPPHPPELYSREPNHCPGSLMGDPAVMMTLLPRVPEVVPAQSQPGSLSSCWAAPAARPAPWTQRPVPPGHQQHQGTARREAALDGAVPGEQPRLAGPVGLTLHPSVCPQETLVLLLKSLPLGCYFNIYGFGSEFESFYPCSCLRTGR
ncbi:unnamed protein product [Eretmochelys imbricata]